LSKKEPNHRRNAWQRTNYRSMSPAEKLERAWRQLAKPPAPREGSTRAKSARNVALARAWRPWSDIEKVVAMYRACAVLNELGWGPYCVDHIVPIQGAAGRVAGFHTHDNLQVITVEENKEKGHWWWPQMWPIEKDDEWSAVEYATRTTNFTI